MQFTVASGQTLITDNGLTSVIKSKPIPMSGLNYLDITVDVHKFFRTGAGNAQLDFKVYATNDPNVWPTTEELGAPASSAGVYVAAGDITAAYILFEFTLSLAAGAAGDIAVTTFSVYANTSQK